MIYVVIPRNNDQVFNDCYVKGAQKLNLGTFQICDEKDENGVITEKKNIFQKYNLFFDVIAKEKEFNDEDIIVFCHEDVNIVDDNFIQKLESVFFAKSEIGILGLAGTAQLDEACRWWASPREHLRGHLLQGSPSDNNGRHLVFGSIGYFNDLVVVDGFFMAARYKVLKETGVRFDESYNCNDMYDLDICLKMIECGYKICVADILCYHQSEGKGSMKESWELARIKFLEKWKSMGIEFPLKIATDKSKIINIEV